MCEQTQTHRKRKAILMGSFEADIFIISERERLHREGKQKNMSMREKKEAITSLLEMVKEHEGAWNGNRIVTEIAIVHGLKTETVQKYVTELIITERIERRGENLYISQKKEPEEE